jgi:hypothetical protein
LVSPDEGWFGLSGIPDTLFGSIAVADAKQMTYCFGTTTPKILRVVGDSK